MNRFVSKCTEIPDDFHGGGIRTPAGLEAFGIKRKKYNEKACFFCVLLQDISKKRPLVSEGTELSTPQE